MIWDLWKQGFTAWEQATAQYMEKVLTNPAVLEPAGAMLTAEARTKAATDRAVAVRRQPIEHGARRGSDLEQRRDVHG